MEEPGCRTERVLVVMKGGGVTAVFATVPVEVIFQDYDAGPDDSDAECPGRQTVVFGRAEVVDDELLKLIIHEDDEPSPGREHVVCPQCGYDDWAAGFEMTDEPSPRCPDCGSTDLKPAGPHGDNKDRD
jgi:hypothetical protein